ncbi:hypothetical protein [Maridesulfovibrio sp.]|uniref:hypothetical protein n=1 Tax=Maridesulfovibrio sp. TaxID=2795000 RepID=UPI0039F04791
MKTFFSTVILCSLMAITAIAHDSSLEKQCVRESKEQGKAHVAWASKLHGCLADLQVEQKKFEILFAKTIRAKHNPGIMNNSVQKLTDKILQLKAVFEEQPEASLGNNKWLPFWINQNCRDSFENNALLVDMIQQNFKDWQELVEQSIKELDTDRSLIKETTL